MAGGRKVFEQPIRDDDENIRDLLTEIRDNQQIAARRIAALEANMLAHIAQAFPGGDAEGHRRYHQVQIEMLDERRRLRVAIQEKTISGLLWAALVAAGTAVYHYYVGK